MPTGVVAKMDRELLTLLFYPKADPVNGVNASVRLTREETAELLRAIDEALPSAVELPEGMIILRGGASRRLLAASKEALRVIDTFSVSDLMEGKDSMIRAELLEAIREMEGST